MSTIHCIEPADTTSTLRPSTLAEFQKDLHNSALSVYVYVGNAGDAGWKIARSLRGLFAAVKVYLVSDLDALRPWVPAGNAAAIVFGFDDQPDQVLDSAEAAIGRIVRNAVAAATR